ncbi:MAG: nickel transporter, partial [Candidatus Limnocylindria bacterium]
MRRILAAALLALAVLAVGQQAASAHPLGNFTVNRYSRIEVAPDGVRLRYVLDLAEIPTLQELSAVGLDQSASVEAVRG